MKSSPNRHANSGTRWLELLLPKITSLLRLNLLFVSLLVFAATTRVEAAAEHPFLHPLFCDHAVLQRGVSVPVWGWSAPGSKIIVMFAGQSRSAVAGAGGKWMVKLKSMRVSAEPRVLSVTNSTTNESPAINDALVSDVWLCSGQPSMEMGMMLCNASNDVGTANFPLIRGLSVPSGFASLPVDRLQC